MHSHQWSKVMRYQINKIPIPNDFKCLVCFCWNLLNSQSKYVKKPVQVKHYVPFRSRRTASKSQFRYVFRPHFSHPPNPSHHHYNKFSSKRNSSIFHYNVHVIKSNNVHQNKSHPLQYVPVSRTRSYHILILRSMANMATLSDRNSTLLHCGLVKERRVAFYGLKHLTLKIFLNESWFCFIPACVAFFYDFILLQI